MVIIVHPPKLSHFGELPAAEQMQVDVENGLPGMGIGIDDEAVAVLCQTFLCCDLPGGVEEMTDGLLVVCTHGIDRVHVLARYDQNVGWCGGLNVAKGVGLFILVYAGAWNFTVDDLAKDTIRHEMLSSIYGVGRGPYFSAQTVL